MITNTILLCLFIEGNGIVAAVTDSRLGDNTGGELSLWSLLKFKLKLIWDVNESELGLGVGSVGWDIVVGNGVGSTSKICLWKVTGAGSLSYLAYFRLYCL